MTTDSRRVSAPTDSPRSGSLPPDFSLPTSLEQLRSILDGVSDGFTSFDREWHVTYMNQASADLLGRFGKKPEDLIGKRIWDLFPGLESTPVYEAHQRAMAEGVNVELEQYFPPPLDSWFQVRLFPTEDGLLSYSHDITAQKRSQLAMEEHTRVLGLSADVGKALTSARTLRAMLQGCAEAMVARLDAAFARVWTLNEADKVLELQASAGLYTHIDGGHSRVPVGKFKIGLIAEERKPHLTNSVVGDPRVGDQEWARREGMVSFAGYPLLVDGRVVGVAAMFAHHLLSDNVLEALAAVADEIGLGIARKRTEEDLAASREWFSTTLASIGDAVIATDHAGAVTFMNPVAEELCGWKMEDARSRPLAEIFRIFNEVTGDPVENPVDKVLRDGGVVGLANHTVLVAKDGTQRAIDDSAAPIRDPEGRLTGVVLVFHDVTEHRLAERRSEAQYRVSAALAEAKDLEEARRRCLQAIAASLNWPLGLFWRASEKDGTLKLMEAWQEYGRPGGGPNSGFVAASREKAFRPGEGMPGQAFAGGRPLWEDLAAMGSAFPRLQAAAAEGLRTGLAFPLKSDGRVLGVVEFFHTEARPPDADMLRTLEGLGNQIGQYLERRRSEEEALQNEALRSAMLGSALDGIVSMDHHGAVIEWNPMAESIFGFTRDEALGKELASLIIPPRYRERHRESLQRYLATGVGPIIGSRIEIMAVREDGTEFPVELAVNRIEGEPPRFTGFIRDITERVQQQEELKRTAEELKTEQARQAVIIRYLRGANRAAARMASLTDTGEILRAALDALTTEFDAGMVALWSYDPQRQRLALAAERGLEENLPLSLGREIDVVMNPYKVGWVARFGRPFVGAVLPDDLQFQSHWTQAHDIRWAAIYPLKGRDRLYGVMAVFLREEVPLGGSDVLATLASVIAGALDSAGSGRNATQSSEPDS